MVEPICKGKRRPFQGEVSSYLARSCTTAPRAPVPGSAGASADLSRHPHLCCMSGHLGHNFNNGVLSVFMLTLVLLHCLLPCADSGPFLKVIASLGCVGPIGTGSRWPSGGFVSQKGQGCLQFIIRTWAIALRSTAKASPLLGNHGRRKAFVRGSPREKGTGPEPPARHAPGQERGVGFQAEDEQQQWPRNTHEKSPVVGSGPGRGPRVSTRSRSPLARLCPHSSEPRPARSRGPSAAATSLAALPRGPGPLRSLHTPLSHCQESAGSSPAGSPPCALRKGGVGRDPRPATSSQVRVLRQVLALP